MTSAQDFSRQSFLGSTSEQILASTRVTIVGLGGGGSHIAQQLAHLGVGEIRLIDPDIIESSNLNRLVGATQQDVEDRTPKVEIAQRLILGIRPWANVVIAQSEWQREDNLIKDSHVLFGCVDSFQKRFYLESAARRYLLPYIDIGMDVSKISNDFYAISGQVIKTAPDGPCMQCLGFLTDSQLVAEENRYGDAGDNPQVVWTNGTLASLAVGEFVKLVTPWFEPRRNYAWLELDGNAQTVSHSFQPKYATNFETCPHHGGVDGVGDPFFRL